MALPVRKHPRLKKFDYTQCGCYHITICVKDKRPILSQIVPAVSDSERACVVLSDIGRIVEHYILNIPKVYSNVDLVKYCIMPNHLHLLLLLRPEAETSVPTIVRSLKRMVSRQTGSAIWQDSFYDVIIRNDSMFKAEWEYIDHNPDKWAEDELYVQQ